MDHTERFDSVADPDEEPSAEGGSGPGLPAAPGSGMLPASLPLPPLPSRPSPLPPLPSRPSPPSPLEFSAASGARDGRDGDAPGGGERFDAFGAPGSGADAEGASGAEPYALSADTGFGPDAGSQSLTAFDAGFGSDYGSGAAVEPFGGSAGGSGFTAFGIAAAGQREERAGGSFDAFAAGAVRPAGENLALPAVRGSGEASLFDADAPLPKVTRPARDPLAPDLTSGGGPSRVERVVAADYVLTVNPIDGTEVALLPPEERRTPVRRTGEERTARMKAAKPAPPPGPPTPEPPLLERDEERERLIRLLARGRSIRVTGPSGVGRTALLDSVANACGELAPDGVIRLSGYHRTTADLLQDLYTVVYAGAGHRPARADLPGLLREVGAVVVLDDLECGGAALEELLAAAPECAFVMSATPDVPAPAADSMVEEVFLSGLSRVACMDLLQLVAGRPLEEDEAAWAADLWFESEGLPLRFVQAGALLRQRDALRHPPEPDWDDSVWDKGTPAGGPAGPLIPDLTGFGPDPAGPAGPDLSAFDGPPDVPMPPLPVIGLPGPQRQPAAVPLPSLAESAAPAELLASRLSESAREALAFAVALDGECPQPSHLPALVGDTHGDAALGELASVGLAVPVAAHYRLAAGVVQHLSATFADEGELTDVQAHTAALHYAWWTGHPSVTAERATAESEAILAAMTACRDGGHATAAVLLARTVAPAFAAALHWGAWERALRTGQEAARISGEVAEEAYFLHELGVLALCTGNTERARAELEASIALRGALADRQGTVVGRRTLALVNDVAPAEESAGAPYDPMAPADDAALSDAAPVVISKSAAAAPAPAPAGSGGPGAHRLAVVGSRRNLVAAGTGVLLAAVLGTFVTLGATSGGDGAPDNQVKPIESVQQDGPVETTPPADGSSAAPPSSATTTASPSTTASTSGPATSTSGSTTPAPGGGTTSPPSTHTSAPGGGGHPTRPPTTAADDQAADDQAADDTPDHSAHHPADDAADVPAPRGGVRHGDRERPRHPLGLGLGHRPGLRYALRYGHGHRHHVADLVSPSAVCRCQRPSQQPAAAETVHGTLGEGGGHRVAPEEAVGDVGFAGSVGVFRPAGSVRGQGLLEGGGVRRSGERKARPHDLAAGPRVMDAPPLADGVQQEQPPTALGFRGRLLQRG